MREGIPMAPELLIISIMRYTLLSGVVFLLAADFATAQEHRSATRASSAAVVHEMNLARQNPQLYASYLQELRASFNGTAMVLPGGTRIRTKEGTGAIDEAIHFLHSAQPMSPLTFSSGMSRAAADHCAEQAGGEFGHGGVGGSNPAARIGRYGAWTLGWGENISYGKSTARDVVIALIVDDGLPARKHRKNIFSPKFNYAGAAFGGHARYGAVCSIEFAGGYAENNQPTSETLIARNF